MDVVIVTNTFSEEDLRCYREAWAAQGALTGMLSSLLVYQLGQARVWFSMSRDGLLPRVLI